MTETQFDIPEMHDVYNGKTNYQILEFNKSSNQCLIYFSSNGLYFPNDPQVFREVIIENDRFEWKKNILTSAGKVILLRDVTKQWYWTGINSTINSIEKLAAFLRHQTRGFEVTCIGSSAGGYASTLFGVLLQAHRVFAFSPQFCLTFILSGSEAKNPTVARLGTLPEFEEYVDLSTLLKKNSTPIFNFYPGHSAQDIAQADCVKNIASVVSFKFESNAHGSTCYPINFLDLFGMGNDALLSLQKHFGTDLIRPIDFSKKVSGFWATQSYLLKRKLLDLKKPHRQI